MNMRFPLVLPLCLALLQACSDGNGSFDPAPPPPLWQNTALVETNAGPVNGHVSERETWSWKGIPFAEPPVGPLRFKPPQPPLSFEDVLEASDYGEVCPQFGFTSGEVTGGEDCLTLNIWRPQTAEEKLPVYVWIHGGGNTAGSANQPDYDGANLANENNVVYVSVQYRLGPFGWFLDEVLHNGDPLNDSGNYGTLDLVAALQWIQDNIEQFGGDPDNVIISGESAGGINVISLLLSPQARGLYHKALSQSGLLAEVTLENGYAFTDEIKPKILVEEGLADDEAQAQQVLDAMSPEQVRDILLSAAPASFLNSIPTIGVGLLSMPFIFPDGSVIVAEGAEAFVSGDYPGKVPLILGTNTGDVRLFLFLLGSEILADPPLYNYSADIGGMLWKAVGADELAIVMSRHADQPPIYVYLFGWGRYQEDGSGVTPMPWNYYMGAAHALDIPFFLANLDKPGFFADINFTEENRPGREALGAAMVAYMKGFVEDGQPAAAGQPAWDAWSNAQGGPKYQVLNADLNDTQIGTEYEAVTVETAREALESIEDPVLREQVRAVLESFIITCTLISDNPAEDCEPQ
jgi:para-nitrobenzyl esterase